MIGKPVIGSTDLRRGLIGKSVTGSIDLRIGLIGKPVNGSRGLVTRGFNGKGSYGLGLISNGLGLGSYGLYVCLTPGKIGPGKKSYKIGSTTGLIGKTDGLGVGLFKGFDICPTHPLGLNIDGLPEP